jgi:microcin C transport system substrate-binding protein
MVYETLVGLHPTTLDYVPALASHWQISPDKSTYRFRIDPRAHFSNGDPVTAEDVVASFNFVMDKGLQERMSVYFTAFDKPVAESKYIVRVRAKDLRWQNFMHFANALPILPSSVLKTTDGARYVKEYNFKMIPGSGPYIVNEGDVVKGKSVSMRRRKDYWGERNRLNIGAYNFDEVREIVVRDQNLALQMFKKGDLDDYPVNISREWVQEFDFPQVQRGVIQKRKIFNDQPASIPGLAINTRRPPYNDIRVRKALNFLFNRQLYIERLFFNEYVPLNSFFARSVYENKNNPKNPYDPQMALALLSDAGFKTRDAQGRLTKDGQPLTVEVIYPDKGEERWLTIYQDDLRKVGITLNLRLVTGETMVSLVGQRKYDLADWGWAVPLFPDPDTVVPLRARRRCRLEQHYRVQEQAGRPAPRRVQQRIRSSEAHQVDPGARWNSGERLPVRAEVGRTIRAYGLLEQIRSSGRLLDPHRCVLHRHARAVVGGSGPRTTTEPRDGRQLQQVTGRRQ